VLDPLNKNVPDIPEAFWKEQRPWIILDKGNRKTDRLGIYFRYEHPRVSRTNPASHPFRDCPIASGSWPQIGPDFWILFQDGHLDIPPELPFEFRQ
jgi:hypothetical protein